MPTPLPELNAITLPWPVFTPPMVLSVALPRANTPLPLLPSGPVPVASVPIRLPRIVLFDVLFDEAWSDDVSQRETAELVAAALCSLPPNEREAVELKTYAGLTFREIADVTGSPQGTVATRYRTGLEHLRQKLTKQLP